MSTEIYRDDLDALKALFEYLEDISAIDGVYQAEIRVKFDEANTWAVVGWGESGDPCLLRFDADTDKTVKISFPSAPYTVNPGLTAFEGNT